MWKGGIKAWLFFLLLPGILCASGSRSPWFQKDKLLYLKPSLALQHYDQLKLDNDLLPIQGNLYWLHLSSSISPHPKWDLQGEISFLDDSNESFLLSDVSLEVFYQLLSDVQGDLLSVVLGAGLKLPHHKLLRNVATLYYGSVESELTLSLGREISQGKYWKQRYWLEFALGLADRGKPWGRCHLEGEWKCSPYLSLAAFTKGRSSFSSKPLQALEDFRGYAEVKQRSLELGFKAVYEFEYLGACSLESSCLIYSKNYLKKVYGLQLGYNFPFSF